MSFFLDTQETVERFGSSVAEFRSLLDAHLIRHGSPEDLFEFTRSLESNNQFRMDLTRLVKSVVNKEGGDLLLTDMMSILAASVGGRSVVDTTVDITKPTNHLMEFLLGTGCWKQFGSPSRPAPQLDPPAPKASLRMEDTEPIPISLSTSPAKYAKASAPFEDKASLLEISNELRRTLSRLESNTEQVKLHLDSIEQRIGKMVPPADVPPANKTSGLEPLRHRGVAEPPQLLPATQEPPAIGPLPTRGRAVFAGRVPFDDSPAEEEDDFSSPTFDFDTEKKSGVVSIAIFIVLAAIAAAVFFYMHSASGSALWARLQGDRSHSSSPAPATPTPPATVPSAASPSLATEGSPTAPASASGGAGSTSSSDTKAAPDSSKIKYVAANIMEGQLLSAPRPEYPTQARMDHIEGQVVLQAIISKSGAVTGLHVTKGPESLRSAAVAAVRDWRYRPYFVDGHAEDVATTVYVDFSLKPPPPIVQ